MLVETVRLRNTGFETKTLWGWMELLIIPLVLALGAFLLNRSERVIERQSAEGRAKLEREIATDRQQEAALQAYLDRIAELLLKEKLRNSENDEVQNVARIRTLTVLRGLDAKRKGLVVRFLHEAKLINKQKPIVNLEGSDLRGANLRGAGLSDADLHGADLSGADLSGAGLSSANLRGANLENANMEWVNLLEANLSEANLTHAILAHAILAHAILENTYLSTANLSDTELFGAAMLYADLSGANLSSADLTGANLESVDLTKTNLNGAKVTNKQLATAKSLKGAVMPDGTKHE